MLQINTFVRYGIAGLTFFKQINNDLITILALKKTLWNHLVNLITKA